MPAQKKLNLLIGFVAFALVLVVAGQSSFTVAQVEAIDAASAEEQQRLKEVFPGADVFSAKGGKKPHYKAYATDPKTSVNTLLGFVFMTHEIEPEEWAYSSEIEALVGMTTEGVITKIKMVDHYEPFGYFSIDPTEFVDQFEGKSILDPFEEGRDIDTVTRATITIEGAARVIRKSARQIARQYLAEQKTNP